MLAPGRKAQLIQLAQPAESRGEVDRDRRVEKLYDVVPPALPKLQMCLRTGRIERSFTATPLSAS